MSVLGGMMALVAAAKLAAFLTHVLLTNLLSAPAFGEFMLLQSIAMFIAALSAGWLSTIVLRLSADVYPSVVDRKALLRFGVLNAWVVLLWAAGCAFAWLAYADHFRNGGFWLVAVLLLATGLFVVCLLAAAIIRGSRRQLSAMIVESSGRTILFFLFVATLVASHSQVGLGAVVIGWIVTATAAVVFALFRLSQARVPSADLAGELSAIPARERRTYFLASLLLSFNNHFPLLIVAFFVDATDLGMLAIALRLSELVYLPAFAFGNYVAPYLATDEGAARVRKFLPIVFVLACIIGLSLIVDGAYLPRLIGIRSQLIDIEMIATLVTAQIVVTALGPVDLKLLLSGGVQQLSNRILTSFAFSLPLLLLLCWWSALPGAAYGVAIHLVLWKWLVSRVVVKTYDTRLGFV